VDRSFRGENGGCGRSSKSVGRAFGEADVILLAQKLRTELIIDEREASVTAQMFGVKPIGTIAVLLLALARDQMTLREFRECLDTLIASGFWLSVDAYNKALEEAQSIAKRILYTCS